MREKMAKGYHLANSRPIAQDLEFWKSQELDFKVKSNDKFED